MAFFLGGWLLTSALAVIGLLTLGHGLLLDMTHGSDHRTGLDLIGGGALIALGGRELIRGLLDDGAAPAWSGAVILAAQLPLQEEIACSIGFSTAATALLLVPFLAVLIGRERVLPLLQRGQTALLRRGELVVGSLSFGLGSYLGWQGISGLMIN